MTSLGRIYEGVFLRKLIKFAAIIIHTIDFNIFQKMMSLLEF